jgi:hypothetical protein
MTEQRINNSFERYANLMQEIKERTLSIDPVLKGRTGLHGPLAREFGYLQLRMICECIALSCLVAHENIEPVKANKFQKEFSADRLMKMLEELHPDFYPYPVRFTLTPGNVHVEEISDGYLTKLELIKLVRLCGDKVHRGSVKKYSFSPSIEELTNDFNQIWGAANKILRLLEQHKINLVSRKEYTFCILSYGPNAQVHVFAGGPKVN